MRSYSSLSSVVASLCLFVVACDSPSGGGGGVDCAKIPTAPACRPDTTGTNDSTVLVPDGSPGTCSTGARQCTGNTPEVCQAEQWVALAACTASQTCTNGTCIDDTEPDCCANMECGSDCGVSCGTCTGQTTCNASGKCVPGSVCTPSCGGKECGGDGCGASCGTCSVNESCQNGQCVGNQQCSCNGAECGEDNCGNSCGTCASTDTCDNGQCIQTSAGAGSCNDLVGCVFGEDGCGLIVDDDEFNACADQCFSEASVTGQTEFTAYLSCANGCGADERCFVQSCSDEQASCFFDKAGSGTCIDILDCFDTCDDTDDACFVACYEASSSVAQAALLGYSNCVDLECPDATSSDDPCVEAAVAGFCAQFVSACQNN